MMEKSVIQKRIKELQISRHELLEKRDKPGASISTIDIQLNIVRGELHALYAELRHRSDQLVCG